ncbi:hypothetical protein [Lysobacter sp. CFH 32150]|uniref:WD40/YVTN/BNR-like repeat-containing protein n=1 Tax=Lysobacter sp. CFH 32150 TaxID=2927128 RepID=UPI001FA7D18C|nr:hypothetical protein [Lysobacter sp. CFH 32150]MCI4569256.1 hypothetical protein [Lysobacter sp. CFH 32150]
MSMTRLFLAAAMLAIAGAASAEVRITPQDSGVKVRLRGISAVSADVAWASGREGTVLRTVDGGTHWQVIKVPDAGGLDFRDVEGFDAMTAVVLSIGPGEASRVYRTEDGGGTWQLTLQNRDPRAFFDCMAFEGERGWMLGDPVESRFQVYATKNGGREWELLADGPKAEEGEAAFAASGTCLARTGDAVVIGSGGSASRLHVLRDGSAQWQSFDSSMGRRKAEAGVFSVAPVGSDAFVVGGDYKAEQAPGNAAGWNAGNKRGSVFRRIDPRGFRSGAACMGDKTFFCIAVGPAGVDAWNVASWNRVSDIGYDAIDLVGNIGWASGDAGRIARIEIADPPDRVSD